MNLILFFETKPAAGGGVTLSASAKVLGADWFKNVAIEVPMDKPQVRHEFLVTAFRSFAAAYKEDFVEVQTTGLDKLGKKG